MREKIVIIGAGGFGREVFSLIDRDKYDPIGFIDIRAKNDNNLPLPILGDDSLIPELSDKGFTSVYIAIGDTSKRKNIFNLVDSTQLKLPSLIHESAVIKSKIEIKNGIIIYPKVVVMSNCSIGKGALLNSGVTLGHDVNIGEFSNINPGANLAGGIDIGRETVVGIGSSIRENITIGNRSIIGAGSVVIHDVANKTMVYGVPAKFIKTIL